MKVLPIKSEETYEWLLHKHYAHAIPSISYAFGLYGERLVGICTYGTPSSSPLRSGICGKKYENQVIELNRLCINEGLPKNSCSYFISKTLGLLPRPLIVVSYSDTARGHHGYIYQATNWIYTGLSAKRTDWRVVGMEHLHGQTIADLSRGKTDRVGFMREKYGNNFYIEDRPLKHRYLMFLGNKYQKKDMLLSLRYKIEPYPKGDNKRYDASYRPKTQGILF